MHFQTQPSQFFTVFGSYILERQEDCLPESARPNSQDIRYPEKMSSVAEQGENIHH